MVRFLKRLLSRLFNKISPAEPPQDPYVPVREPRPQRPGGRDTAVAIAEPEDCERTRVVGGLFPNSQ
jgi:hypothetical protein